MTSSSNPPSQGRKLWLLVLIAVVLLIGYLLYRSSRTPKLTPAEPGVTPPPVAVETPTPVIPIATAVPPALTPTWPPVAQGDWIVEVGPQPDQLSKDPIFVGRNNWVRWKPARDGDKITIFFPSSGFPSSVGADVAPFPGMHRVPATGTTFQWEFNNVSLPIYSGPPNSAFGKPGVKYYIKYWQSVNGTSADGRMIIQR